MTSHVKLYNKATIITTICNCILLGKKKKKKIHTNSFKLCSYFYTFFPIRRQFGPPAEATLTEPQKMMKTDSNEWLSYCLPSNKQIEMINCAGPVMRGDGQRMQHAECGWRSCGHLLCVCSCVSVTQHCKKGHAEGERDGEKDNEREAKRERGAQMENTTWVCRPVPKGHTVTEPSTFCICCAGGRGNFTHISTHTQNSLFFPLLSQFMIEWSLISSRLFLPLSLSVHLFPWQSTFPLCLHLYLIFIVYFSYFQAASVGTMIISSHTFLLFPPRSLSSIFSSCYISKKLTFPCFFLETAMMRFKKDVL